MLRPRNRFHPYLSCLPCVGAVVLLLIGSGVSAELSPPPAPAGATSFYREADSYGTRRDPDPPRYVREAENSGWEAITSWHWLDIGLDYRFRYEYRDDDIRRAVGGLDEPLLHRTRLYLGVREALDPFRFALEVEDARRYNSQFPRDNRDVNEFAVIRLYGELYFKDWLSADALGNHRPVSLRYGIHNFEFLDRRLIGNNQWRNTANTFQGFQAAVGQEANDWQLDLLAVQPLERKLYAWDRPVEGQWLFALIGHWRRWSEVVTLEPFYLALTDSGVAAGGREVHSPGVRAYGRLGQSGWDYDVAGIYQFGQNGALDVSAWATTAELGYRLAGPWQLRVSVFYGHASGDADPADGEDNRFEKFFGFARPWSANDYITFDNVQTPKVRVELTPSDKLRLDFGHSWYWLDSATDLYRGGNARDVSGRSGRFMGHEFDARIRWQASSKIELILGYAHFVPGEFTRQTIRPGDTDFAYLECSISAF
jgi:hypothetical protein